MRRRPILTAGAFVTTVFLVDFMLLPWSALTSLQKKNPALTAFQQSFIDRERAEKRKGTVTKHWRSIDRISENLVAAVIVAEDGTFWSHEGFDWFELKESLVRNIKEQRAARGASTITQQLIKNLFLSPSKNPLRKYHEWLLTWYAERTLTKRRILELYLNEIEWGRGLYGAEAASRRYFGVSASELTREQAARLAAVIPNPVRFHPLSGSKSVERRVATVLRRLEAKDRVRGRVEDLPAEPEADEMPSDTLNDRP
ncbi:MAG: monofunctional biosynthetic peptidoglycan transglycosylase [Bacteroidetes bacterium]|nr:monofunctional biosynthetic peptidoglycan transglycosylase [Bacteroidota bacterium]